MKGEKSLDVHATNEDNVNYFGKPYGVQLEWSFYLDYGLLNAK